MGGGAYTFSQNKYSAGVVLETVPEGADVYFDGALRGKTPFRGKLEPGKHEVKVSMPHFEVWESQVELQKGTDTNLPPISLIPEQQ